MIPWHPHTELPEALGTTAIIAAPPAPDDDPETGWALLSGMFFYTDQGWRSEEGRDLLLLPEYWWCAELDLIAHLMPRISSRSNGHG